MFECPLCKGKTKVKQTNHETMEMLLPKKYDENGNVVERAKKTMPMIRRKIQCEECGMYFITREVFERLTEETERQGWAEKDIVRDCDGIPAKIKIQLNRNIDWNDMLQKAKAFDDTGAVYSEVK